MGRILILTLLLGSSSFPVTAHSLDTIERIEATVNGGIILLSEVGHFYKTLPLRAQLDPLFAGTEIAKVGPQASKKDVVKFLIEEKLISQQFVIDDEKVEQQIKTIQSNNHIDRRALKKALKEQGFEYKDYFELIRISISKRDLIDRDIRTKVYISDNDVKNYFYNTLSKDGSIQSFRIKILTITPGNYKSPQAARDTIHRALKTIRSGQPFEKVVKTTSDDSTASSGGDLGFLDEDNMSPQIREAVKKLRVGKVSPVLGSANTRYYLLYLADVKSGQEARFEKVKENLRSKLAATEYQRQVKLWIDRQRQRAHIHMAGDPSVLPIYIRK